MDNPILPDGIQFDPRLASKEDYNRYTLIDIRDRLTAAIHPINFLSCEKIPMSAFRFGIPDGLSPENSYLIICYHGNDSLMLAHHLREGGFPNVYSVVGGFDLLNSLALEERL
jgi:rhodanese-related sulfurtransferase